MKIKMVEERTGPRHDGRAWPPPGGELYVEDDEGAAVCAHGWAVPVPEDIPVELRNTRSVPEKAAEPPEPPADPKPAVNAPKAAWVAHATTQGMAGPDAEAMTKADLVARFG